MSSGHAVGMEAGSSIGGMNFVFGADYGLANFVQEAVMYGGVASLKDSKCWVGAALNPWAKG